MTRHLTLGPALLLACCVLLAGCGAVDAPAGPSTPTSTVTPVSVPTDAPTTTATPAVAGGTPVEADSLANLSLAHASALENRSFTAVERRVVLDEGGALYDVTATTRVAADRERYRYDRTRIVDPSYPGPQGIDTLALYHEGNRTAFRDEDDGGVRYGVVEGPFRFGPDGDHTGTSFLAALVPAFDRWTVRQVDDARILRGDGVIGTTWLETDSRLGTPREATVRLRVEADGRVSRLRVDYRATLNGRSVTVRIERRYGAVGETTVAPPVWLDEALATASAEADS